LGLAQRAIVWNDSGRSRPAPCRGPVARPIRRELIEMAPATSRDRCGLYAAGADLGAPQAQQVADRFHLVLNLSSTMERVLEERSRLLILPPVQDPEPPQQTVNKDIGAETSVASAVRLTSSQQRRQRRLERYQQVVALANEGRSQSEISRELGIERKTVRRWLRRGQFPERKSPHRRPPKVSEFADYLQQRWNEGCHNATRLYQEIRGKGYKGKRAMVARFVSGWRTTNKPTSPKAAQTVAPRHAAILVTRPADKRSDDQRQLLDRIVAQCPEVTVLRRLALDFRDALSADESTQLRQWVENAKRCEFGQWSGSLMGYRKTSPQWLQLWTLLGAPDKWKAKSTASR
jgi:transposase